MRWVAALLLSVGAVAGVTFVADYMWGARGLRHTNTARDILISASGILLLVVAFWVDAVLDPPWLRWVPTAMAGLLASVMFPVWWRRLRRLRAPAIPDEE